MTAKANPSWRGLLANPVHALAFGFGSGLSPKAPGTVGTLAAVPLYVVMSSLPLLAYSLMLLVTFVVGVYLCDKTSKDLGVHDHPGIVWDEFVGYWITMLAAPAGWLWIFVGFVWFRIFDVLKPWPINWLDKKVEGGFGIMIDDVLAGLMALVCVHVTHWLMVS
ncbi:MAG: phosphatidylglycerophosphatase A [Cellvibrionaceae bacterium]|nr:phosphatidylglycerophosphatase A [Cellvibrionaceae bacterium]